MCAGKRLRNWRSYPLRSSFRTSALTELFPDWKERGAPLQTAVTKDEIYYLGGSESSFKFPGPLVPRTMDNHGNYIISLGNLCAWLGEQAMELGAEVFPGFAAAEILYHEDGSVKGVATGDMGVSATVSRKRPSSPVLNSTPSTPFLPKVAGGIWVKSSLRATALMSTQIPNTTVSALKRCGKYRKRSTKTDW